MTHHVITQLETSLKMVGAASVSASVHASSSHPNITSSRYKNPSSVILGKSSVSAVVCRSKASIFSSITHVVPNERRTRTHFVTKASSSTATGGESEYIEEPATNVKFQTSISLPGCSSPLLLLGTGYREKVFAIIGVKVYAAGLYVHNSILSKLRSWSGRSSADIQNDTALFKSIYEDSLEKSLQIVLVRDVDGKTFWDALNDAISTRIKSSSSKDESALQTFRSTFEGRPLKKGTLIFLTWLEPSKMLVYISPEGVPSVVDAMIESRNVTEGLFDVFFGDGPVSPTLKASVSNGLASMLK